MLIPLLIVVAVLIGGLSLVAIIEAWVGEAKRSPQSLSPRQISLWSLVLFLFFPWLNSPSPSPLMRPGELGR